MKITTIMLSLFITMFITVFLFSCGSIPINISNSESWSVSEKSKAGKVGGKKIKIMGVSVDRSGVWESLEKEVSALAPLYFWNHGFRLAGPDGAADYAAHISLREREFASGWTSRRSLALEVRIWAYADGNVSVDTLPLAAGRIVKTGNLSFSSSKTTGKMLNRTIKMAIHKLPRKR
jgi:hypothetical protein